jgi:predicted nucleic acid-binding protein
MIVLVDTNILLRLMDRQSAFHSSSALAIELLVRHEQPAICAQIMIEFWAVATRPTEQNGLGLTTVEAESELAEFEKIFEIVPEPPDISSFWKRLALAHQVSGKQAHDTRIAALMMASGISHLLTRNSRDFARFHWLTCLAPEDLPQAYAR